MLLAEQSYDEVILQYHAEEVNHMGNVILTDTFHEVYEPLGMSSGEAVCTVTTPSRMQELSLDNLALRIFVRAGLRSDAIALVIGELITGDIYVQEALWFPASLVTAPLLEEPIYLLRVFAEQYGAPTIFGGRKSRFHYRQVATVMPGVPKWTIQRPPEIDVNTEIKMVFVARMRNLISQDGIERIEALFLSSINIDSYQNDLKSGSLLSVVRRSISYNGPPEEVFTISPNSLPDAIDTLMLHLRHQVSDAQFVQIQLRSPEHPLAIRYEASARLKRTLTRPGSVPLMADLATVGSVAIDANTWAQTALELPIWKFAPDPAVQARLRQNATKTDSYEETLSQLYIWAALRERGLTSNVREDQGLSDLDIFFPDDCRVPGEVKCIRDTTNPRNIRNHLKKASKQLKASPGANAGIIFLRILTNRIPLVSETDAPELFLRTKAEIQRLFSYEEYSGIESCVLVWESMLQRGSSIAPILVMRRQSEIIERSHCHYTSIQKQLLAIGQSITLPISGSLLRKLL